MRCTTFALDRNHGDGTPWHDIVISIDDSRRAASRPPQLQPQCRYQEIGGPYRRVARDLHDGGRHGRMALRDEEHARERGLRAAQDHRPLRADLLPATQRRAELQQAGKNRPDAEHREHRMHAGIQSGKNRQRRGRADRDVDRLGAVRRRSAAAGEVGEIGERIPRRINDQQDRRAGRALPADGKCQRDPEQREYRPGKVIPFQPLCVGGGTEFRGVVSHLHSFVNRIVVPAGVQRVRRAEVVPTGSPVHRVSPS